MKRTSKAVVVSAMVLGAVTTLSVPEAVASRRAEWRASYTSTSGGQFTSVDAVSPRDVFAVGTASANANSGAPVVEHFNGTSWAAWHQASLPADVQTAIGATGVAARSIRDVWLTADPATSTKPVVVAHWNGRSWSDVTTAGLPPRWTGSEILLTSSKTWLIGQAGSRPMIATYHAGVSPHWSYTRGLQHGALISGSVRSGTDAWVVGYGGFESGPKVHPLAEHWNGKRWKHLPVPGDDPLDAVAIAGQRSVLAVEDGVLPNSGGASRLKVWNGDQWHTRHHAGVPVSAVTTDPRGGYLLGGFTSWHRSGEGHAIYTYFRHGRWSARSGPSRSFPPATRNQLVDVQAMDTVGSSVWSVGAQYWCTPPKCVDPNTAAPFVDRNEKQDPAGTASREARGRQDDQMSAPRKQPKQNPAS